MISVFQEPKALSVGQTPVALGHQRRPLPRAASHKLTLSGHSPTPGDAGKRSRGCFPRSQAGNRGASVTVLDLKGAAGGAQIQPLPPSLGHTSSVDSWTSGCQHYV